MTAPAVSVSISFNLPAELVACVELYRSGDKVAIRCLRDGWYRSFSRSDLGALLSGLIAHGNTEAHRQATP